MVQQPSVRGTVQFTLRETVAVLLQPSMALNVLVCVLHPPVPEAADVLNIVTVGVPHPSVAVAVPKAASISDAEGLHPSVTAE